MRWRGRISNSMLPLVSIDHAYEARHAGEYSLRLGLILRSAPAAAANSMGDGKVPPGS